MHSRTWTSDGGVGYLPNLCEPYRHVREDLKHINLLRCALLEISFQPSFLPPLVLIPNITRPDQAQGERRD